MDKFFEAYVSGSPPAAPNPGATGYPADGGVGIPATVPGAYWFYAVTTEILNEISAASLTPNKAVLTQLRDSITTRIANAQYDWAGNTNFASAAGHRKFPDGTQSKWCQVAQSSSWSTNPVVVNWTYDVPFPSFSMLPVLSAYDTTSPGPGDLLLHSVFSFTNSGGSAKVTGNGAGTRAFTLRVDAMGQ